MSCKYNTPECTCSHEHDRGACTMYEQGGNGMCVYCDHHKNCHEKITAVEKLGVHNRP